MDGYRTISQGSINGGSGRMSARGQAFATAAFAVVVLAGTAVLMATLIHPSPAKRATFGFEDQFNRKLSPSFASVQWITDAAENAYVAQEEDGIVKYTLEQNSTGAGTRKVLAAKEYLVEPGTNTSLDISSYSLSQDQRYIMLATKHEKLYRHSSFDVYVLYDTTTHQTSYVVDNIHLQYAEFAPVGHKIAYVVDNNLHIFDIATRASVAITADGKKNSLINGVCDWAYEEEVFGQSSAIWWSPDAKHLAFLKFKETEVPEYQFPMFDMPYDKMYTYKYPKSGATNSDVTAHVYGLETESTTVANLTAGDYIIELAWFGASRLAIRTMPRLQNTWQLHAVDPATGAATALSSESHPEYLSPHSVLKYLDDLDAYVDQIVVDGYDHLVLFNAKNGERIRELTKGKWQVDAVLGVHKKTNAVYFTSTAVSSIDRALYSVTPDGTITRILTRDQEQGVSSSGLRTWQTASFSPSGEYYVLHEQSDKPSSTLRSSGSSGTEATLLHTIRDNKAVVEALGKYELARRIFFKIPGMIKGTELNAYMLLPPGLQEGDCRKHPMLVHVYGGPGAQQVTSKFSSVAAGGNNGFHTFMASTKGYAVLVLDAIGTGAQGDEFQKKHTYQNLGVHEAMDVEQAIRYVRDRYCFVDKEKIALWGWSYGGFLSSMVAGLGTNTLKSVVAVAPVADWALYDSIYTERYMRRPVDNPEGYNASSVLTRVQKFNPNTHYLLVHGTADDNVHFQNGVMLAKALIDKQVQFQSFFYPNRDHSLLGPRGEQNPHLYKMLASHFDLSLGV